MRDAGRERAGTSAVLVDDRIMGPIDRRQESRENQVVRRGAAALKALLAVDPDAPPVDADGEPQIKPADDANS